MSETNYLPGKSFIQTTKTSLIGPRVDGKNGQRNNKE